jgi:hypothetical protein
MEACSVDIVLPERNWRCLIVPSLFSRRPSRQPTHPPELLTNRGQPGSGLGNSNPVGNLAEAGVSPVSVFLTPVIA